MPYNFVPDSFHTAVTAVPEDGVEDAIKE